MKIQWLKPLDFIKVEFKVSQDKRLDPDKVQEHVISGCCYLCDTSIVTEMSAVDRHYSLRLCQDSSNFSLIRKTGNRTGSAALLRFCINCWHKIAGEKYCFKEEEYE